MLHDTDTTPAESEAPQGAYAQVDTYEEFQAAIAQPGDVKYVRAASNSEPLVLGPDGMSVPENGSLVFDANHRVIDARRVDLSYSHVPANSTFDLYDAEIYLPDSTVPWAETTYLYDTWYYYDAESDRPRGQNFIAQVQSAGRNTMHFHSFVSTRDHYDGRVIKDGFVNSTMVLVSRAKASAVLGPIKGSTADASIEDAQSSRLWGLPVWSVAFSVVGILLTLFVVVLTVIKCRSRSKRTSLPRAPAPSSSRSTELYTNVAHMSKGSDAAMDSSHSERYIRHIILNAA